MATLSLRRLKENCLIGLPSKTIETCYVNLSEEEREVYDKMEGEAQGIVKGYISDENMAMNYTTILSILVRLRQICTHLSLCPSDIKSLLPTSKIEGKVGFPSDKVGRYHVLILCAQHSLQEFPYIFCSFFFFFF